jgi:UDP-N-acetylmuramate--alanine ligase
VTLDLEGHRHVHFVGIGGVGMSALARVLLARGIAVSGSDRVANDQTEGLARAGARVHIGHRADLVEGADLVVITPAAAGAPDVAGAREKGIRVVRRAEILGAVTNTGRGIAVAGTHGKSTTSGLIGHMLVEAGLDPTVVVGGVVSNLGSNARVGGSDLVVVEADEFDSAFLELDPEIGVILSVEPEHLDYFETAERMEAAFGSFASRVRGLLVLCADDVPVSALARDSSAPVLTYGLDCGRWRAWEIEEERDLTRFRAGPERPGRAYTTALAGRHNVRNALAALAVADHLGVPADIASAALAAFRGVGRRSEIKGEEAGVLVMDDYGHHPTEIRKTLAAIRRRYRRPLRVLFQPHTYSRTRAFLAGFAHAFDDADCVYVLDIYAARETDTLGVSGEVLARAVAVRHPSVTYTGSMQSTLDRLLGDVHRGDLVVTMGAGDVHLLGPAILDRLRAAGERPAAAGRPT